eukprot:g2495.t1
MAALVEKEQEQGQGQGQEKEQDKGSIASGSVEFVAGGRQAPLKLHHATYRLQEPSWLDAYTLVLRNAEKWIKGKTVLELGAGVGMLSILAAKLGAKKVYVQEATALAPFAAKLARSNGVGPDRLEVFEEPLEDLKLPEKVDLIVSFPMALLCLHEKRLSELVVARERWLKEDGHMLPSSLSLHAAPLEDESTHAYMVQQAEFWKNEEFFDVDISSEQANALNEHCNQPFSGLIDQACILAQRPSSVEIDLRSATKESLENIKMPLTFSIVRRARVHSIGCWFTLGLSDPSNSETTINIQGGPHTHTSQWYICRFVMNRPKRVRPGPDLHGSLVFYANKHKSYDVVLLLGGDECEVKWSLNNSTCSAMVADGFADGDGGDAYPSNNSWWFASGSGEQKGPYTEAQVNTMMESGSADVGPDVLAWKSGMSEWRRMCDIPAFDKFFSMAAPPL